jgi:hypothetical protein
VGTPPEVFPFGEGFAADHRPMAALRKAVPDDHRPAQTFGEGGGDCGRDLEIFWFPDNGQGKGRQKLQVQTKPKHSRKISHILWSILTNFDLKKKDVPSTNCGF